MERSLLLLLGVCSSGLEAQDTQRVTAGPGDTASVACKYPAKDTWESKVWCREDGRGLCDRIITTIRTRTTGRITLVDNKLAQLISVTVEGLKVQDTGVYWCGVYDPDTNTVHIMKIINLEVRTDLRSSVKPFTTEDVPTDSTTIHQEEDPTPSLSVQHMIQIGAGLGFLLLITLITAVFYGTRMRRQRMQSTKDVGDKNSRTNGAGPGTSRNGRSSEEDAGVGHYELDQQELKYASLTLHANRQHVDGTYSNIGYGRRPASDEGPSEEPVEYANINLQTLHGASAE